MADSTANAWRNSTLAPVKSHSVVAGYFQPSHRRHGPPSCTRMVIFCHRRGVLAAFCCRIATPSDLGWAKNEPYSANNRQKRSLSVCCITNVQDSLRGITFAAEELPLASSGWESAVGVTSCRERCSLQGPAWTRKSPRSQESRMMSQELVTALYRRTTARIA